VDLWILHRVQEALLNALLLSERPPRELADLLCTERTADCNDKSPNEVDVGLDGETKSIAGGAGATTRDSTGLDAGSADDAERGADSNVQKKKGTKKKKKKNKPAPRGGRAPPKGATIGAVPGN
jgi:hypothetical protein